MTLSQEEYEKTIHILLNHFQPISPTDFVTDDSPFCCIQSPALNPEEICIKIDTINKLSEKAREVINEILECSEDFINDIMNLGGLNWLNPLHNFNHLAFRKTRLIEYFYRKWKMGSPEIGRHHVKKVFNEIRDFVNDF